MGSQLINGAEAEEWVGVDREERRLSVGMELAGIVVNYESKAALWSFIRPLARHRQAGMIMFFVFIYVFPSLIQTSKKGQGC